MNTSYIKDEIVKFLYDFDALTFNILLRKPVTELDETIRSYNQKQGNILELEYDEKVRWLVKNNIHPFRQLAVKLKNKIENKIEEDGINKTIADMCNARFLDSIGVPGYSDYSDLIANLADKLYKEKNTCC